jgi:hypothetical protein
MKKRLNIACMILIACGSLGYLPYLCNCMAIDVKGEKKPKNTDLNSPVGDEKIFSGKILVLKLAPFHQIQALERAKLRGIGNSTFVVGRAIDIGNKDWLDGKTVWHTVNSIVQIAEFESVEDVKKSLPPEFKAPPSLPPGVDSLRGRKSH